jgi:hypothetical protein
VSGFRLRAKRFRLRQGFAGPTQVRLKADTTRFLHRL